MKAEKFFFPLMVFAAVIAVYLFFRKSAPAISNQPSTAASGLPNNTPQAQNYQVAPYQSQPTPFVMLSAPQSADPTQSDARKTPPSYLAFNFGPSHDLTKKPFDNMAERSRQKQARCAGSCCGGGCGSGNGCDKTNVFPDGQGQTKLASTRNRQVENSNPDQWLLDAYANLSDAGLIHATPGIAPVDMGAGQAAPETATALPGKVSRQHTNYIEVPVSPFDTFSNPYKMTVQ